MRSLKSLLLVLVISIYSYNVTAAEKSHELLSPGWSF